VARYQIVVVTGDTDWESFQTLLKQVLRALTAFPSVGVRFGEYHPDRNGTG
jgi:hypothetical protein